MLFSPVTAAAAPLSYSAAKLVAALHCSLHLPAAAASCLLVQLLESPTQLYCLLRCQVCTAC